MYDSIDVATVPRSASAVAGYVGGHWPTFKALVQTFPHAHHLSIAVNANEDAEALDIENGDATPQQAGEWARRQLRRGVYRPVLYASASIIREVVDNLQRNGLQRSDYRLWSAHYTLSPHICGHGCGYPVAVDATQWTDRALGRNLDESLCLPSFFDENHDHEKQVSVSHFFPEDEARWEREWIHLKGIRTWNAHQRRVALKRAMTERRKAIYRVATSQRHGWSILNRYRRYMLLKEYTK